MKVLEGEDAFRCGMTGRKALYFRRMRPSLLVLLAAASFCACSSDAKKENGATAVSENSGQPFAGWRDVAGGKMSPDGLFYSETGQFFAAFPGMPVHEARDVETQAGKVRMETYVYEESVTMAYMVAYTNYPSKFVIAIGADSMLMRAEAGALQAIGITGEPTTEKVVVNDFPGVRYRANSEGRHIVSQILLAGNRLFQLTMLSDGAYPADAVVEQFFSGFHLTLGGEQKNEEWWPEGFPGDTAAAQ